MVLLVGFPAFLLLQIIHWIGFLLDECFFSEYRRIRVEAPLFVTGVPRGGTTYVHRTLARDSKHFTTLRTWEVLLAPSIIERRFWKMLGRVDRALGGFGRRATQWLTTRICGDFDHVHSVGFDAPEEDYLLLLPAAGCFILVLAFPFSPELWHLARISELPDETRHRLLVFYRRCLQKHLYEEGRGRRLLSKNAAFGSWIPELRTSFPGARFLLCVRPPESALASQLSSLAPGRRAFGSDPDGTFFASQFQALFERLHADLRNNLRETASTDLAVIDQRDLRHHPREVLRDALEKLGVQPSGDLLWVLDMEALNSNDTSSLLHRHQPAARDFARVAVGDELDSIYEEILTFRSFVPVQTPEPSAPRPEQPSGRS